MTPSYCTIQYSYSTSLPNNASSAVAFDNVSRQFTVQSNDLTLADTYQVTVSALSPSGSLTGTSTTFDLLLVNPCLAVTFTIDSSAIASPITYSLFNAAA